MAIDNKRGLVLSSSSSSPGQSPKYNRRGLLLSSSSSSPGQSRKCSFPRMILVVFLLMMTLSSMVQLVVFIPRLLEDDSIVANALHNNATTIASRKKGGSSNNDPIVTSSERMNATIPIKCDLRDLTKYNTEDKEQPHKLLPNNWQEAGCFPYTCHKNINTCDNTHATNFDGPDPPCCTHILRDIAREFDIGMCKLGLDYAAAFGTLLGLTRSDRLIPWTADNDYIISQSTANAMVDLWDTNSTGLANVFLLINRMCVHETFADGKLLKWRKPYKDSMKPLYTAEFPYVDFYVGVPIGSKAVRTLAECTHLNSDIWPTQRKLVYNQTFYQNIPNNSDGLLKISYGPNWRIPSTKKNPHGNRPCQGGSPPPKKSLTGIDLVKAGDKIGPYESNPALDFLPIFPPH